MESSLVSRCVSGFARDHNLNPSSIEVVGTTEKSINLQPKPGPGEVSAGILAKCLFVDIVSPIGNFTLYTPVNGKGKLYTRRRD